MPFIINVGVSRKASKDYQSTGYSLNLTAELDSGLLADSNRLQNEIERIYSQATIALNRQVEGYGPPQIWWTTSRGWRRIKSSWILGDSPVASDIHPVI